MAWRLGHGVRKTEDREDWLSGGKSPIEEPLETGSSWWRDLAAPVLAESCKASYSSVKLTFTGTGLPGNWLGQEKQRELRIFSNKKGQEAEAIVPGLASRWQKGSNIN